MDTVIDEILGVKLLCKFEVPLAENLFKCTFRDRFVLFLQEDAGTVLTKNTEQMIKTVMVFIAHFSNCDYRSFSTSNLKPRTSNVQ